MESDKLFLVLIDSKSGYSFSFMLIDSREGLDEYLRKCFSDEFFTVKEVRETTRYVDDPEKSQEKEFFEIMSHQKLPCGDCSVCCKVNWHVVLEPWEKHDGLSVGMWSRVDKKDSGECVHCRDLGGCEVYENRPATCKAFNCMPYETLGMIHPSLADVSKVARGKMREIGYDMEHQLW
ncbi:YkgJ family cysteine cluster protein [Patescibacteria group bacterium]